MSTTNQTTPPAPVPTPQPRKKHWILRIILLLVLLIVVVLALIPTLLSASAGNHYLLGKINASIPGRVEFSSLSIGYFSGAKISDLKLYDPEGKFIVNVPSIDTGLTVLSLMSLAGGSLKGDITIHIDQANLVSYADGTTNVSRALTRPVTPAATPAEKPAAPPAPPAPASSKALVVKSHINLTIAKVTWAAPRAPDLLLENTLFDLNLDTAGGPVILKTNTLITIDNKAPALIEASGSLALFENGRLRATSEMQGSGSVTIARLQLASLQPWLESCQLPVALSGQADGHLKLENLGTDKAQVSGELVVATPVASGSMLQNYRYACRQINVQLTGRPTAGNANVLQLDLQCRAPGTESFDAANKPLLASTDLLIAIVGQADLAKSTFRFGEGSKFEERDPATPTGNSVALESKSSYTWAGSKASESLESLPYPTMDLTATAKYDLLRLQKLLAAFLPADLIMEGRNQATFHVTGSLAPDAGLKKFRLLTLPATALGFDRIALPASGVDLGKGELTLAIASGNLVLGPNQIPCNGGTLGIAGRVDLNAPTPTYVLEQKLQLVSNMKLNKQIASGPMAFLPLAWGAKGEQANLLNVAGLMQVQLASARLPLNSEEMKKTGILSGLLGIQHLSTNAPIFDSLTSAIPGLKAGGLSGLLVGSSGSGGGGAGLGIKDQNIENVAFNLQDGKVSYKDLPLRFGTVSLNFSGAVGMDKTLAMNLVVSEKQLQIPIPVGISGTVQEPKLSIEKQNVGKTILQSVPGLLDRFAKPKK